MVAMRCLIRISPSSTHFNLLPGLPTARCSPASPRSPPAPRQAPRNTLKIAHAVAVRIMCVLNIGDVDFPVGLNIVEDTHPDARAVVADAVVSAMRSIWFESWGPRLETILRYSVSALIEIPNASLVLLPRVAKPLMMFIRRRWRLRAYKRIPSRAASVHCSNSMKTDALTASAMQLCQSFCNQRAAS